KVAALIERTAAHYSRYKDAVVIPFNPPSIPELGTAAGFDFELTDNAGLGHDALMAARNQLLGMAEKDPTLALVRPNGLNDTPQYKVDIDREKANALGVTASAIDQT
ncbi:efflux RND transporter permease subunit, partial [Burkholderia sp. SIMBA_052]